MTDSLGFRMVFVAPGSNIARPGYVTTLPTDIKRFANMKKIYAQALAAAVMAAATVACTHTPAPKSDIDFVSVKAAGAFSQDGTAEDLEAETDLRIACRLDLLMPSRIYDHDITPLRDTIQNIAFGSPEGVALIQDFFRRSAEEFGYAVTPLELTEAAADSIENTSSALTAYDGFVEVRGYLELLTPKVLSYAINYSSYAPRAAHGMYGTSYVNYDVRLGRMITLEDLFSADGLGALPEAVRKKAIQMRGYIGRTDITSLPAGDNFTLSSDGDIILSYQPYEVASYAQGEIRVPMPAYEVDQYLTPYGKSLLMGE